MLLQTPVVYDPAAVRHNAICSLAGISSLMTMR